MKTTTLILLACAVGGVLGACSGDAMGPHGTSADVTGIWDEDFGSMPVPGNYFSMVLVNSADVVSGSGEYRGEAGPFGTLKVYGTAKGDSVHLTIVKQPDALFAQLAPDTSRFEAVLTTRDRIDGTVFPSGAPSARLSLTRLPGDQP